MDDTPRRVGRSEDLSGRAPDDITSRSTESVRGYSASTPDSPAAARTDADTAARAADLRRDIEQTREEMSETIDAIQEKLRPGNLVSGAAERVRNATTERVREMTDSAGDAAGRMMSRAGESGFVSDVRQNPIPAALVGIGAAWWWMSSRSRARDDRYGARARAAYRQYEGDGPGLMDRLRNNPVPVALAGVGIGWLALAGRDESGWDEGTHARTTWRDPGDERGAASSAIASVSDAASTVAGSAQEMTSRAQDYTREAAGRARQTGRRAQSRLQQMTRENPLAVGAGALLLGAAVGLAIPETERENELMGEARESMIDRAQDMARNAASRAQEAASDLAGEAASRVVGGKPE